MNEKPRLLVDNLVKRYRRLTAVDALSLKIMPGEFVGFIGPNGAGKSTTMGCITGLLAPDGGRIEVAGIDVAQNPVDVRRHIGFVPQELNLYDYLTGEEFLRFVADVRGITGPHQDNQVEELLHLTELSAAKDRLVKEYSGGMARKIAICAALIGPPELLLLDESFVGLDPESTLRIRRYLQNYCTDGGAILLSSHILDMLERICTRVVILVDGKLKQDLSKSELDTFINSGKYPDLNAIYLEATGKDLS